ncbi:uncharacterized protein [Diadema antillarum]|uniref:uncharacterized protein n=1 Tax=Diadema antillarum TaxID=105358 RepID=UPI003A84BF96
MGDVDAPSPRTSASGKITAHNLHLLMDDEENQDAGRENGGEEEAAPQMPDDDLNLRTATADSYNSSAASRKLDDSPVGSDTQNPPANLVEETRYQEELRERVKRSFADLGIEPEGVLLKDSLEETPRDSLEIKEELPYDSNVEQGEYTAERRVQNNEDDDIVDEANDDKTGEFLNEENDEENDTGETQNSAESPHDTEQGNDLRDSLEAENVEPELQNLNESNQQADGGDNFGVADPEGEEEEEGVDDYIAEQNSPDGEGEVGNVELQEENPQNNDFHDAEGENDPQLVDSLDASDQNGALPNEQDSTYDARDEAPVNPEQEQVVYDDNAAEEDEEVPVGDNQSEQRDSVSQPFHLNNDGSNFPLPQQSDDNQPNPEDDYADALADEYANDLGDEEYANNLGDDEYANNLGDDEYANNLGGDEYADVGADEDANKPASDEYPTNPGDQFANNALGGDEYENTLNNDFGGDDQQMYSDPAAEESAEPWQNQPQSMSTSRPSSKKSFRSGRETYIATRDGQANGSDGDIASTPQPVSLPQSQLNSRSRAGYSDRQQSANYLNANNNADSPDDKPPSGNSVRSHQSSTRSRSGTSQNRHPGSSRHSSRERGLSSRSRQASLEREASPASRQHSGERRNMSSVRRGSAGREDLGIRKNAKDSPQRGSSHTSRRGSNEITIPRYANRGMGNRNDGEENFPTVSQVPNEPDSSKSQRTLSGSNHVHRQDPIGAAEVPVADGKPPSGLGGRLQASRISSAGSGATQALLARNNDPSSHTLPVQQDDTKASQQFWSDMHKAGVPHHIGRSSGKKSAKNIEKLRSGEKVRVEYISDDSGDEDLHFVDEKGSPIDELGRPLYNPKTPDVVDMRIMYRIKPSPPKQSSSMKSSSGRQRSRDISATSSKYSARIRSGYTSTNSSAQVSSKNSGRRLVDRQVSPIEDEVMLENTQQQGDLDTTLPPPQSREQSVRERPVKSAALQTGDIEMTPSDDTDHAQNIKSPVREASIQTTERETAIQTSDEHVTGESEATLPYQSPYHSPRENGPFGQVRVTPLQRQSPGFQMRSPRNDPHGQYQYPGDAFAQPVPVNYPSNPHAHWQPGVSHPAFSHPGQVFAAPLQPHFANPMMAPQMIPLQSGPPHQHYPGQSMYPAPPQHFHQAPFHSEPPHPAMQPPHGMQYSYQPEQVSQGGQFIGHDIDPAQGDDAENVPEQEEKKQPSGSRRPPPKPRANFIDINKTSAKLRRDPPSKKYTDALNQKKGFRSPLNNKNPLPQISRENSQDDGQPVSTGWTPHGSATSRANDLWAQQVLHEQQMVLLARGMSDPNIYAPGQMPGPPRRHGSVPGNYPGVAGQGGMHASQDAVPHYSNGQPYSWSADRANTYARMNGMHHAEQGAFGGQPYPGPMQSFDQSPRERMAYTHPMPKRTSPYQVLPDISGRMSGEDSELRTSDPDGYVMRLQKQKQGPQYRPYTLKDFQNLKKDFKLGGLGPDKDSISVKQDKAARQREYAKLVMQQNKKVFQHNPNTSRSPSDKDSSNAEPSKRDLMLAYADTVPLPRISENRNPDDDFPKDSRTMALEYAKHVPKPRIPTPPEILHDRLYGSGSNSRNSQGSRNSQASAENAARHAENMAEEMARLQDLTERHRQEKEELDRLRREIST